MIGRGKILIGETMRTAKKKMKGFDYRSDTKPELTINEWREELRRVILNGGWRRHEKGETFAHDNNGRIVFEVYGYLGDPS